MPEIPSTRTYRTPAIVLQRRDMGEADRLLTLLTPRYGKISAVAKGVRKPRSKATGHVELFAQTDVLLAKGRNIDILTQAEIVDPHLALLEDLTRAAYANYAAEMMDRVTMFDTAEDTIALYNLLERTLSWLCTDDDPRRLMRFYEMHVLDILGYRPELSECVITRDRIEPVDQYFSYSEGGVVSPDGVKHVVNSVDLPLNTLKLLRHIQRNDDYSAIASITISPENHRTAEQIMLGYMSYLLERRLLSVDFIHHIRRLQQSQTTQTSVVA